MLRWQQIPVAQVARQLATVVAFGVSNATAIYLGKTIGAKEFHLAKEYGKRFLWLSIITGAVGGGIILIAAPIANHVMTLSQEAQGIFILCFFVMSYFTLCQAINTSINRKKHQKHLDHIPRDMYTGNPLFSRTDCDQSGY